ncbi:MAG: efflux transporter outer membrane subunit [Pseudomonadota bacterium]
MQLRQTLTAIAMALSLTGCTFLNTEYTAPTTELPSRFSEGGVNPILDNANTDWWTAFNDATLNSLVDRGLIGNLDIQIAGERLNGAIAVARGSGVPFSGGLVGASAGIEGSTDGPEVGFSTAPFTISYLLDFFGELREDRKFAARNLQAAGFDVQDTRLIFLSALATAYAEARFFQESIRLTRLNLDSRERTLELTRALLDAAAATRLDVIQAEGLVNEELADLPGLEADFRVAAHRVSVLLGLPATALVPELSRGGPQPIPARSYETGVPADLLRNRPDIRAAERDLAAAVASTGVARAELYPSISLSGFITPQTIGSNGLVPWSFGPVVSFPIFGRETIRAGVDGAEAAAREALLIWKSTVLTATEEVENALVAGRRNLRTIAALQRSVEIFEENVEIANISYEEGRASLLGILEAERELADAREALAAVNFEYAVNFILLNVAIGSGRGASGVAGVTPELIELPFEEGEGTGFKPLRGL